VSIPLCLNLSCFAFRSTHDSSAQKRNVFICASCALFFPFVLYLQTTAFSCLTDSSEHVCYLDDIDANSLDTLRIRESSSKIFFHPHALVGRTTVLTLTTPNSSAQRKQLSLNRSENLERGPALVL
jgi:hypothetical protein